MQQPDRRHYPKDNQGAKDEWQGIEKHFNDVTNQLQSIELEIKGLKAQALLKDYEQKQLENMIKR